jgi:hypothetical protein
VCTVSASASSTLPKNKQISGREAWSSKARQPNAQTSEATEAGRPKAISGAKYDAGVPRDFGGGLFMKNDSPKSVMRMPPVNHFSSIFEYWIDSITCAGAYGPAPAPDCSRTGAVRGLPSCSYISASDHISKLFSSNNMFELVRSRDPLAIVFYGIRRVLPPWHTPVECNCASPSVTCRAALRAMSPEILCLPFAICFRLGPAKSSTKH